jgi:long-chain acyl-CoA synthetase
MTHPSRYARSHPQKVAATFAPSGRTITYGELDAAANRVARLLRSLGIKQGDAVVFCVENDPQFLQLGWGCQRIGVRFTPASSRLSAGDLAYIVEDSGAKALILSVRTEAGARVSADLFRDIHLFSLQGPLEGFVCWEGAVEAVSADPVDSPVPGREMMYSSGTTGRPKGVRKPMPAGAFDAPDSRNAGWGTTLPGTGFDMVHLCTSPLYHAAPHRSVAATLATGGMAVIMEQFDPVLALQCIETHRVTHSLWVPTMFHRLLRLPEEDRRAADLSSHVAAHHGAAPCPVHIKEQMIDWWGPVLFEYYAGTEGIGACSISSEEWLAHKGSVGRAIDGIVHILDANEDELYAGETGTVHFEGNSTFEYWNDQEKTLRVRSKQGWWTYGDIGHVDAEGYLYLTDRRDFVIITGGVNVYPQEIEDFLGRDLRVLDSAVFGVPDDEFGEAVQAIVQVLESHMRDASALGAELRSRCREALGPIKTPKDIRIVTDFPRLPTGKLHKKALRSAFLAHLSRAPS